MSEIEWKIEDGELQVNFCGKWQDATPVEAATILRSAIEKEKEACARIADEYAKNAWGHTAEQSAAEAIATAIRARGEG